MMNKIKISDVIMLIIVLILILTNIIIYTKKVQETNIQSNNIVNENSESSSNTATEGQTSEEQELEKLKAMNERERMEYYFSEFISYIKDEDYSKAYDLLYPEFKENYFKTLEEFSDYAKKTYPKSVAFSYNDIQRQGYIYVLIIDIIDPTKNVGEEKSQRIVIQENDFNDFVLSFQVI